jgi:TetR/AcrR family fatty acid metabolism transcriptional regulator
MAPKIVDKELKKQEILQAAMKAFGSKGFANTKMIEIALEAGIGKGTIYEYFKSKDEIIDAVFTAFLEKLDGTLVDLQDSELDSIGQLFFIIDGWTAILSHDPLEARVLIDLWAESTRIGHDGGMNVLIEVVQKYRDYIAGILEAGVEKGEFRSTDVQSMANLIAATLDGLYLYWILGQGVVDLQKSIDALKSTLEARLKK